MILEPVEFFPEIRIDFDSYSLLPIHANGEIN
jgi:hypothetical protein